jgi:hypothetical protein
MYHCFDGDNTANGFCSQAFCSNEQHAFCSLQTSKLPPCPDKPASREKVSPLHAMHRKNRLNSRMLAPLHSQFPDSIF